MADAQQGVELGGSYSISEAHKSEYQRDGHVLLRAVASPEEMKVWQPLISGAAKRYNTETRPVAERDAYGKAFLQIPNLWEKDEAARRFVLAKRFGKVAADLMGVEGVRLYHDQALFKEPGGGGTPWHQDQYYWPLDTEKTITMWMPLVDCTEAMGTMRFASGSQNKGYLGAFEISEKSDQVFHELITKEGFGQAGGKAMAAGDATFHCGWVLHNANGNSTERTREAMTIIYYADGAKASQPQNKNQEQDLKSWFPGLKPGDLAATARNPLVYSRS